LRSALRWIAGGLDHFGRAGREAYSPSCGEPAFATLKAWPPQTAHVHSRPCLPPRHKLGTGGTAPTCALAAVRHISRLSKVPHREQRRPQRSSITGTLEDKPCRRNRHISATAAGNGPGDLAHLVPLADDPEPVADA
jgi:hypothetical protein